MSKRFLLGLLAAILFGLGAFLFGRRMALRPENQKPGKFPEQVVFVRSTDDVVSGGVMFTSPKQSSKPLVIIWVHGWGRISTSRATSELGGHWQNAVSQRSRSIRECTT